MQFIEDSADANYVIDAHGPGWVSINHVTYSRSLVIMPDRLESDWLPFSFSDLGAEDLTRIIEMQPEILLIGTGKHQRFPDTDLLRRIGESGVGCEFMDTAAACRTYTVLMAEKRQVAAALLLGE